MFSNLPLDTQLGSCRTEILPDFSQWSLPCWMAKLTVLAVLR